MTEEHTHFRENLAAYALGALDAEDIHTLEDHLASCQECQIELADYLAVSDGLLAALPPQAPSPALRRRLSARLPRSNKPARTSPTLPFPLTSFKQLVTAIAFVILIGLNLFSALQVRELQRQQAELTQRMNIGQSAIAMLAYPETKKLPISEGVAGSLLVDPDAKTAVLFTWNLPELAEDEIYQIWLIDSQGNRVSGGLFAPDLMQTYTSAKVTSPFPLSDFVGLGVTIEPWGGSPGPTGPNVLKVSF
jgi:anti-sigma-K factor RskA